MEQDSQDWGSPSCGGVERRRRRRRRRGWGLRRDAGGGRGEAAGGIPHGGGSKIQGIDPRGRGGWRRRTRFDALGEPPICGDGDFSVDMDQVVKELGDDLVKDLGEVMARGWPKAGPYTAYHEAMMEELQEGVREAGGEDELPDSGPDDDEAVEALLRQVTKTQDSLIKTRDSFTKTRDSFTKTQDSFDRFIR